MKQTVLVLLAFCMALVCKAQQLTNVSFSHDGKTVYGTFAKPGNTGKFPVIIINPGSGANDRHGTFPITLQTVSCLYPNLLNTTIYPYRDLSTALVAAGYAVLRYDKLEYTYNTTASLGPITFHKLWLPVESAIDYVKTRPDVDTSRIILIGHSEGSSLIPYIAKKRNDVKALISIAGPRTPFDSLIAYQMVHFTQLCNGNVPQAQAQAGQILNYFTAIRNNTWNAATPPFAGAPASAWADYTRITDSVAINYNQANLPTLFTGLQLDLNVPLTELTRFQNQTNIGADFYQIPGLIHYMTPNNVPQVSKVLTDTIIYWLGQRVINGVKKPNLQDNPVQVFPNPFSDQVAIAFGETAVKKLTVSVESLTGQKVAEAQFSGILPGSRQMISLEKLPPGIYILHLNVDGKLLTRKIVKQERP
jgi:dienelactone hydrolase